MRWFTMAAAVCLLSGFAIAADEKGKAVELFDGKTLKGWKIINCEVEARDGAMLLKSGNGVVRPEKAFKDFVLDLEWKALKPDNWDSGIYIRCKDPAGSFPWPRVWQVNLRKGDEGNIQELKDARSKGLIKAGEWNKFKLTVVGTKAELEINGQPAWKADGIKDPEGFISIQAEVPGGGQFLYRNIRIEELNQ